MLPFRVALNPRKIRRRATSQKRRAVEKLEHRLVLSAIDWIGPASGSWDVASNWSTGTVPGAGDDVTIDTAGPLTITIQSGDSVTIGGLTTGAGDTLSITGGSLTVTAGTSTLNGPLYMTGGSLASSGAGADLTAGGATLISGANLYADAGGLLNLPNLTSYSSNGNIFEADGVGSVLALRGLNSFSQTGTWALNATNGGELDLDALKSLVAGVAGITLTDTDAGRFTDPVLSTLQGVTCYLDGADPDATGAWTTFTDGTLNVSQGISFLASLTNIDRSSLYVSSGGRLALPQVTSYVTHGIFEATGVGSVLDISKLANVKTEGSWWLQANEGAEINLSGLDALDGFSGTNGTDINITIDDYGNSTILDPNLRTLNGVGYQGDGTDSNVANSWTVFTGGNFFVQTGSYNLPRLTDIDQSSFSAYSSGSLSLPSVTAYQTSSHYATFAASGPGAVLDLSALTKIAGQGTLSISAQVGGTIKLSGVTSLVGSNGSISITDTGHSRIMDGALTNLHDVFVGQFDGTDPQIANSWTSFTGGTLQVAGGGPYNLADLTDIDGATIEVSDGGQLALPAVVSYAGQQYAGFTADGAGSTLDLPALNSLTTNGQWALNATNGGQFKLHALTSLQDAGNLYVNDTGGSAIVAPSLTSLYGVNVTLDGTDATIADSWTTLRRSTLTITGGSYTLPNLTDLDESNVFVRGGSLRLPGLTSYTSGGSILEAAGAGSVLTVMSTTYLQQYGRWNVSAINGGQVAVDGLTSIDIGPGASIFAMGNGSSVELPDLASVASTGTSATVGDGGSIMLGTQTLNMPLPGSAVTISVPQLPAGMNVAVDLTTTGIFGAETSLNVGQGDSVNIIGGTYNGVTFNVQQGATVDLTGGMLVTYSGALTASGSGTVRLTNGGVTIGTGGLTLNFPTGVFQWTGGQFSGGLTNTGVVSILSGSSAAVVGDFINAGTLMVGAASKLSISGNFAQTSGGTLLIPIDGTPDSGQFGQVAVHSEATLGGALNVDFENGFVPRDYAVYQLLTFGAANGDFAMFGGPGYLREHLRPLTLDVTTDVANTNYVTAVYHDVLGRAPDAAGLAYWTNLLDNGAAIGSVAMAIAHSGEYYANFVIKPDYLNLLGRAATDTDLSFWTTKMEAGLTDQQLEARLISSPEFFQAAGGTNAAWIQAVYKQVLGRSADTDETNYWSKQLSSGATLGTVALQIADSKENNAQLIKNDYFQYLGRQADDAGLAYWLAQFAAGETNEDVIAGFTGSPEYYQQHSK